MKVIETVRDNRTGDVTDVSWGSAITSDMSIITSVANIIDHQRAREAGEVHTAQGRFETLAIRIEL